MLYEIKDIQQYDGEDRRRWFFDNEIDLLVWFDEGGSIVAFQLCYDKIKNYHALTWRKGDGYKHNRVDDGESDGSIGRFKVTPILFMDGLFDKQTIADSFLHISKDIPKWIAKFVYEKIKSYS